MLDFVGFMWFVRLSGSNHYIYAFSFNHVKCIMFLCKFTPCSMGHKAVREKVNVGHLDSSFIPF